MKIKKLKSIKIKFLFFFIFLFILTLYILFFFPSTKKIMAQSISLSLSPPLVEVVIKPNKSILIAYTISNYGDPVILNSKVLPFEPKNNLGQIKIKENFEGPIRFSLDNSNLKLNQSFFLKTNESQQLLLRIRVPEGVKEGDYYYTFIVENQALTNQTDKSASFAKASIGANILITVTETGKIEIKPKVVFFEVLPRFHLSLFGKKINFFDSNDPIPIVLIIENQGKNLIKAEGEIILKGNFGEKAKFNLIPQNILSESQRLIKATPSAEINCNNFLNYKACKSPISLLISGFFLGFYQLSTTVFFGENSLQLSAKTSFFAFPIKILIVLILILIISIFIIKKLLNKD